MCLTTEQMIPVSTPGWLGVSGCLLLSSIPDSMMLELKTLLCQKKKDTQDTEEILTRHFFWWKGCTHVFPQGERTHKHTWLSVAPPYIPNAVVPAPVLDWSRSKVYNLSLLNKGLEDGLRHTVWRAIFPARELYKNPSDETGTIKQYNLRWRHKEL
jgi:hypothetical protein